MSKPRIFNSLGELLAGRWQIPLALVAAAAVGFALYRARPQPPQVDLQTVLTDLTVLEETSGVTAAANAAANLLELKPPLPPEQRAALHDRVAELLFRAERDQATHRAENARRLLEHDRAAQALGAPTAPEKLLRAALARQWLGENDAASAGLQAALAAGLRAKDRWAARRALVELLVGDPVQRTAVLEDVLREDDVSAAQQWWALHTAVSDALAGDNPARARELLTAYGDGLKNSDLKGYLDYLWACVALHEGRPEEAAPMMRWVDTWLKRGRRASQELDGLAHLPSLNSWLAGRIALAQSQPADALAAFDEALEFHPGPELRISVHAGRGLALAALERHPEALTAFQVAVDEARRAPARHQRALAELQQAVTRLAFAQQSARNRPATLDYLTLAAALTPDTEPERQLELFEQLGREYQAAAVAESDPDARRRDCGQAGHYLERAAQRARFDETRLAALLWNAANEYDRAGRVHDMQRMLRQFIAGRTNHPAMPRAVLQMARAYDMFGDVDGALTWYQRVIDEYPRLEEAARAKVLRAGVLVSLGAEHFPAAEQTLTNLLADGSVAPSAAVYRDALLALCELVYHQERFAEAIGRLQDFLALYPEDPEQYRARFMLADAHRRSAYVLRDQPPAGEPSLAVAAESRQRFRRAADLFDELLSDLGTVARPDAALRLYARLALFYRGDCLFELNEPDTLQAALAVYRAAAARYDTEPAALTAQVQAANTLLRLGDVTEAARAVERARWLLRSIPAEAFTRLNGGSRAEWEQFLSVLSSSDLFQTVFAARP